MIFAYYMPDEENNERAEDKLFQIIMDRAIRIPRNLSVAAARVLSGFLNKDPNERLGCNRDIQLGFENIKAQRFFESIDWQAVSDGRQLQPPHSRVRRFAARTAPSSAALRAGAHEHS